MRSYARVVDMARNVQRNGTAPGRRQARFTVSLHMRSAPFTRPSGGISQTISVLPCTSSKSPLMKRCFFTQLVEVALLVDAPKLHHGAMSMISGTMVRLEIVSKASAIGSLNRRGPALPGFT